MKTILVVIGSVRPRRVGPQIATWLVGEVAGHAELSFEILDLRDWPLPMNTEPAQPKQLVNAEYATPETRAFSRKIAAADGFILLTPQYNWGYPAALKNALDHLYHEWTGKPATILSYGARGGAKAAAQLKEVLTGLGMRVVEPFLAISLKSLDMDDSHLVTDPNAAFAPASEDLRHSVEALVRAFGPAA